MAGAEMIERMARMEQRQERMENQHRADIARIQHQQLQQQERHQQERIQQHQINQNMRSDVADMRTMMSETIDGLQNVVTAWRGNVQDLTDRQAARDALQNVTPEPDEAAAIIQPEEAGGNAEAIQME